MKGGTTKIERMETKQEMKQNEEKKGGREEGVLTN